MRPKAITLSLMSLFSLLLISCHASDSTGSGAYRAKAVVITPDQYHPQRNLELRGTLELPHQTPNGLPLHGLSGLAWDEHRQLLYAISDLGYLYHLKLSLKAGNLVDAKVTYAVPIQGVSPDPRGRKQPDTEGIALHHDDEHPNHDELLISFEGSPQINAYDLKGHWLRAYHLPPPYEQIDAYQDPNEELESVIVHPQLGILSAAEFPLRQAPQDRIDIFSLDGQHLSVPRASGPHCGLADLQTTVTGDLLLLERCFRAFPFRLISRVRLAHLSYSSPSTTQSLTVKTLFSWDTSDGWKIDNFEGLARLDQDRFLLVSDDNANPLQRTLLVLIKLDTTFP
jgi:hypothetical protein